MANTKRSMSVKKLAAMTVATVALTGSAVFGVAGPAAASDGVCDTGELCLWDGANREGHLADFVGAHSNYNNTSFPGSGGVRVANRPSSVQNRGRTHWARVFVESGPSGAYWNYPNSGAWWNIGSSQGVNYNNNFEAHTWYQP